MKDREWHSMCGLRASSRASSLLGQSAPGENKKKWLMRSGESGAITLAGIAGLLTVALAGTPAWAQAPAPTAVDQTIPEWYSEMGSSSFVGGMSCSADSRLVGGDSLSGSFEERLCALLGDWNGFLYLDRDDDGLDDAKVAPSATMSNDADKVYTGVAGPVSIGSDVWSQQGNVLVTTDVDGLVHEFSLTLSGSGTLQISPGWLADTRRTTVCGLANDSVGNPTIQLRRKSNAQFTNPDDLVFVVTRYSSACVGPSNRIYAYNLSDGTTAWEFNASNLYDVGPAYSDCTLDYGRNYLYCTTANDTFGEWIWAFDTNTGALEWTDWFPSDSGFSSGADPGTLSDLPPVLSRDQQHLYVLLSDWSTSYPDTIIAHIFALDPDTGSLVWNLALPTNYRTAGNVVVDTRPDDPQWLVVALRSSAYPYHLLLYRITDNGPSGEVSGEARVEDGGSSDTRLTGTVFDRSSGMVYAGDSDGLIHEYDVSQVPVPCDDTQLSLGLCDMFHAVSTFFPDLFSYASVPIASLVLDSSDAIGPTDRLMAVANDVSGVAANQMAVARFPLPWSTPSRSAGLQIQGVDPNPVPAGGAISYTLTITNVGSTWATDVMVTFAPSDATVSSVQPSQGVTDGSRTNLGDLAPAASATVVVQGTAEQVGTFPDIATVSANEAQTTEGSYSVEVTTVVWPANAIFLDSFESGDTGNWSGTSP